jgi:hypothetical protein
MGHDGGDRGVCRTDVTPEGQQALYQVLRATNGPGREDPGAVYVQARTASVATTAGAVHLSGAA